MKELFLIAATKPWLPMILAIFLYVWIAVATYHIKQTGVAVMWIAYAVANAGLLYHMLYELKA